MTQPIAHGKMNLIEAAMGRLADPALGAGAAPNTIPIDTRSSWRREQDRALKLRLEKLQISQGLGHSPIPAIVAPSASAVDPAQQRAHAPAPLRRSDSGHGIGTLLSVALVGALVGAGLMWIAINGASQQVQPWTMTRAVPAMPATVVTAAVPAPEPANTSPESKLVVQVDTSDSQARELIEGWRQAWANRDADAYLTHYSPEFAPANGQKRTSWAEGRQRNFAGKSSIQVTVNDLRFERLSDNRIKAFFLQDYTSGSYRETAQPKTFLLERTGQQWKIAGEWEGDFALTAQATQ